MGHIAIHFKLLVIFTEHAMLVNITLPPAQIWLSYDYYFGVTGAESKSQTDLYQDS